MKIKKEELKSSYTNVIFITSKLNNSKNKSKTNKDIIIICIVLSTLSLFLFLNSFIDKTKKIIPIIFKTINEKYPKIVKNFDQLAALITKFIIYITQHF